MQARLRKIESGIIYCETCEAYCPDTAFSSQAKHILVNGLAGVVQCESCEHGRTGMTQAETIFERCVVCRRDWPESGFQRDALQAWRDKKQQHLITCAGCVLIAMRQYRDEERECTRCNQKLPLLRTRTNSSIGRPALEAAQNTAVDLVSQHGDGPLLRTRTNSSIGRHALEAAQNTAVDLVSQHGDELPVWSPVTLRIFLDRGENSVQWLCYNCLHPACSVSSCRERPRFPARRLPDTTEPYLCNVCLWPLCSGGCGAERPRETRCRVMNMAQWYCSHCKPESKRLCPVCQVEKAYSAFTRRTDKSFHDQCKTCEETWPCKKCGERRPREDVNHRNICTRCRSMKCRTCGKAKHPTEFGNLHRLCKECESRKKCKACGKVKQEDDYESRLHQTCKQCTAAEAKAKAKEQRKCNSCRKSKSVEEDYESRLHQVCKQCKAAEATAKEQRQCRTCTKTKGVADFRDTGGRGKSANFPSIVDSAKHRTALRVAIPTKGTAFLKLVPVSSISVRSLIVASGGERTRVGSCCSRRIL